MDTRTRILIGALGGIAPVLVNLVIVDLVVVFSAVTPLTAIAYGVRVFALICVGGMAAWLHEDELKPARIFQLGMLAPALLTGMLNGAAVRTQTASPVAWSFETVVYAEQDIRRPPADDRSALSQITQGFFGQPREHADVLVVVADAETPTAIRKLRDALTVKLPAERLLLWQLAPNHYVVSYGDPLPLRRASEVAADLDRTYKHPTHLHALRAE